MPAFRPSLIGIGFSPPLRVSRSVNNRSGSRTVSLLRSHRDRPETEFYVYTRRSTFLLRDFTNYDLKEANVVMIFAVPRTMPVLGRKIRSECSDGTHILAYRFEMPSRVAAVTTTDDGVGDGGDDDDRTTTITTRRHHHTVLAAGSKQQRSETETEGSASASELPSGNDQDDKEFRLEASCIYDEEEMRIYRMGG